MHFFKFGQQKKVRKSLPAERQPGYQAADLQRLGLRARLSHHRPNQDRYTTIIIKCAL